MLEAEFPYEFEKTSQEALRDTARATGETQKLAQRLGLGEGPLPAALADRLTDLIISCHLNIQWYQRKLSGEVNLRRWYFALSLAMLAMIPLVLFVISFWTAHSGGNQAIGVTTQLSAILTGLLAFQRGVSAWLDKRQVVAGYSKACSDLKSVLYTFEQAWDSVAVDPARYTEFLLAIRAATAKCKDIVRQETDQYFQTLSYPTIDVGSLLNSSTSDAQSLVRSFTVPANNAAPASAVSATKQVASAKVQQLRQRVDELDAQLAVARAASDSKAITDLTPLRDSVLRELRAAEVGTAGSSASPVIN
jgi:hypothetical protein